MKTVVLRPITAILMMVSFFSSQCAAETFRVMLHTGSFPPYFFAQGDTKSGTIRDIFGAIAQETGDHFEYIRVPFKRALHQFEAGEVDIEPMTNPAYRGVSSVPGIYSIPYTVAEEIILFNKNHYTPVDSPEDLLGQSIGVVNGYYYPKYSPYFEDGRIRALPFENENKLVQLLLAERLAQVLINKDFAQYEIQKQQLADQLTVGKPYHVLDMMIRFHPNKQEAVPRFNQAIKKLLKDGTIERIYKKYR